MVNVECTLNYFYENQQPTNVIFDRVRATINLEEVKNSVSADLGLIVFLYCRRSGPSTWICNNSKGTGQLYRGDIERYSDRCDAVTVIRCVISFITTSVPWILTMIDRY